MIFLLLLTSVLHAQKEEVEDRFLHFDIGELSEGDILYQAFDGTYSFDLGASLASALSFKEATLLIRFRTTESRNFMTLFSCTGTQTNALPSGVMLGLNQHGQVVYRGRNLAGNEFIGTAGLGFNDGRWHTAVVSAGPKGSVMYVDGRAYTHIPHKSFLDFLENPNDMRIGVTRFALEPRERWFFHGDVETAEILGRELAPATIKNSGDQTRPVPWRKTYKIPLKELSQKISPLVFDREPSVALGPVSSTLLPDGLTAIVTYRDSRGGTHWRTSTDLGLRWSPRQPGPNTATTPALHSVGNRVLMVYGTQGGFRSQWFPINGKGSVTPGSGWAAGGTWGGSLGLPGQDAGAALLSFPGQPNHRMFYHDGEGRGLVSVLSLASGREQWSPPERFQPSTGLPVATPCVIPSADGKRIALIQASPTGQARICFSGNQGGTFSQSLELPASLAGEHHVAAMDPQSKRLVIVFWDRTREPFTRDQGDWMAWVGTFDDLLRGRQGKYRVRLMKNWKPGATGRSGIVVSSKRGKEKGVFLVTGAGSWKAGEAPYLIQYRFKLSDLDRLPVLR